MHKPLRKGRKKAYIPKPELVPVLDAMFIMIFFILTTSEFIKISEIGSDLPVMKLSMEDNPEKKKLILKMSITADTIKLINDVDKKELFSGLINDSLFAELNAKVQEIKNEFPDEQRVMVTPDLKTKYEIVIKALDAVREVNKSGVSVKLFNQIMFE